jgi:trans-aconitate methyltransferase
LNAQERAAWQERAEAAVGLLLSDSVWDCGPLRIADLGCGNERVQRILERRAPGSYTYQGYDLHPQSGSVIKLDIAHALPSVDFDVAICLGVLEYLDDVPSFLRRLGARFPFTVLSYSVADSPGPTSRLAQRRALGWRTDYTSAAVEAELARCGFVVCSVATTDRGAIGLWLVSSAGERGR